MTIVGSTMRIVFSGTTSDGEIFQWGFWSTGAPDSGEDAASLAADVRDVWATSGNNANIRALVRSDTHYTAVKIYGYPSGGPTAEFVGEAPITTASAGTGNGTQPLFQCLVVSTQTGLAGRTRRGRFYLPASGLDLDGTHRFTESATTGVATTVKALMDGINAIESGTRFELCVLSQKGAGSTRPITSITVNNKPDVQRRRENRMAPGFTSSQILA